MKKWYINNFYYIFILKYYTLHSCFAVIDTDISDNAID